jgi:hypothetical protein
MHRGSSRIFINTFLDLPQHVSASYCHHQGVVVSSEATQAVCIVYGLRGGGGHTVAQWLRHCAKNRKVAGSIPDDVRIIHDHNPSGRTMTLGSTQPLTEMRTRNVSWG